MHPGDLQQAAQVVRRGGLVAYPTEYCFGLGCDPLSRAAVLRLLRLKRRPTEKGLILIASDIAQLARYVEDIPDKVLATWPGPHTWLLEAREGVPGWITGKHPRIAVRVTAPDGSRAVQGRWHGHRLHQRQPRRRYAGAHRPRCRTALRSGVGFYRTRRRRRCPGADADSRRRHRRTGKTRIRI